jgi:hypothetical protein
MEAMREAWTDERLDDLANRMDRGFDRVDKDLRELRGEMDKRFDRVDGRFEAIDIRLDGIQKAIVQAAIGMTAAFLAGFAALVVAGL